MLHLPAVSDLESTFHLPAVSVHACSNGFLATWSRMSPKPIDEKTSCMPPRLTEGSQLRSLSKRGLCQAVHTRSGLPC